MVNSTAFENTGCVSARITLTLTFQGRSQCFSMPEGDERAISVGSASCADIRLEEPGIFAVHFHFERDGGTLWLTPTACSGSLWMNATRLWGPVSVPPRAVLEFAGQTLEVHWQLAVSSEPAFRSSAAVGREGGAVDTHSVRSHQRRARYVRALPGELDPTLVGPATANSKRTTQASLTFGGARPRSAAKVRDAGPPPEPPHSTSPVARASLPVDAVSWGQLLQTQLLFPIVPEVGASCRHEVCVGSEQAGDNAWRHANNLAPPRVWREWPQSLEAACRLRQIPCGLRLPPQLSGPPSPAGRRARNSSGGLYSLGVLVRLGAVTLKRPALALSVAFGVALLLGALAAHYERTDAGTVPTAVSYSKTGVLPIE